MDAAGDFSYFISFTITGHMLGVLSHTADEDMKRIERARLTLKNMNSLNEIDNYLVTKKNGWVYRYCVNDEACTPLLYLLTPVTTLFYRQSK